MLRKWVNTIKCNIVTMLPYWNMITSQCIFVQVTLMHRGCCSLVNQGVSILCHTLTVTLSIHMLHKQHHMYVEVVPPYIYTGSFI